ncbi:MAG: (Fe-S)-binding protein [Candidatus Thermoplasmatota archaeon]
MAGKWDWLKDEIKGFKSLSKLPLLLKFIKGKVKGPGDVTKCTLCPNMCRHACPIGIVDGRETTSPSGKSRIGLLIQQQKLSMNKDTMYPVYMCLSCGCCEKWCPFDFSVSDILRPIKENFVKKNKIYDEFKKVVNNLEKHDYVYDDFKTNNIETQKRVESKGKVLYLSGCSFRENFPDVPQKAVEIIENLGYEIETITEEKCCGIPAYHIGDMEAFNRLSSRQTKNLNQSDVDFIVTSCPSCAYAYRVLYPENGDHIIKPEVYHFVEFFEEKQRGLKLSESKEKKYTYHDPCKLVHGLNKADSVKKILQQIPGINLIKPRRNGEKTFCCGYGGSTVNRLDPELSDEIAVERLNELMDFSKNIVTACPTCKQAFEKNKKTEDIKIIDISELIFDLME